MPHNNMYTARTYKETLGVILPSVSALSREKSLQHLVPAKLVQEKLQRRQNDRINGLLCQ